MRCYRLGDYDCLVGGLRRRSSRGRIGCGGREGEVAWNGPQEEEADVVVGSGR